MSDPIHERGKALEDNFYRNLDQTLIQKMKEEMQDAENKKGLASATGIDDDETLEKLVAAGVTAEALTSLSMVPLVTVAWSDGQIQENERDAIMKAAAESGIVSASASYGVLLAWLNSKPEPILLDSWKAYIHAIQETLDEAAYSQLKSKVLGRAKAVAEAAGGLLGMGTVSPSETKVLEELEATFGA